MGTKWIVPLVCLLSCSAIVPVTRAQDPNAPLDIAQCPAVPPRPPVAPTTAPAAPPGDHPVGRSRTETDSPTTSPAVDRTASRDRPFFDQPAAAIDIPRRLPARAALETPAQQQHAQAVQDRAIAQDESAYDSANLYAVPWGQPPVYVPNWISIDIPENSVAAPAVTAAPAARSTTPTVAAKPPKVGSHPRPHIGSSR